MNIIDKLKEIKKLFIDTAPIIYFVEKHPDFFPYVAPIFNAIDNGEITAVTSPITLAESLIFPIRLNQKELIQGFSELIVRANNTEFVGIEEQSAKKAAEFRVKYNLSLMDALQIATAIGAECDSFLTNDLQLKRVVEIEMIVIQELAS